MNPTRLQSLTQQIEEAFADVTHPDDNNIGHDPDDWEADQLATAFKGKHWRELTPEELQYHSWSFLSSQGLHYYLPAYLLAAVADYGNILPMTIYGLTLVDDAELRRYQFARFGVFTPAQKQAIRSFLEYARDEMQEIVGDSPRKALDRYWGQDWV